MGSFLKKDMLLLTRDKKDLAILLLMPLILIAILGFALGGFLTGSDLSLEMKFILVNEDDEAAGTERFLQDLSATDAVPAEEKAALAEAAQMLKPAGLLIALLDSEEFAEVAEYSVMEADAAKQALENKEAAAVMTIPSDFTYDMLHKMLLNNGEGSHIGLDGSSDYALSAGILHDILNNFARTVNFQTALHQVSPDPLLASGDASMSDNEGVSAVNGGTEFVTQNEPISSMQYYTFGMAVMFVMYVATVIASKAYSEKRHFTFDRLIMAGTRPIAFLGSKMISAIVLAFLQLTILFLLSSIIFQSFSGKSLDFWLAMLMVTMSLAVCIGGLASLLTSLNFRVNNESSSDLFSSVFVSVLAFLGGSFFPTALMVDWLGAIGAWTPNGAALYSYMQVAQGADVERYMGAVIRLLVMAACFIAASLWIFPRRRVG